MMDVCKMMRMMDGCKMIMKMKNIKYEEDDENDKR